MLALSGIHNHKFLGTHLVVLVYSPHPAFTFFLRDYLPSVFNNDLVGCKVTVAPNSISTIGRLDDLDPNVELASSLATLAEAGKAAIAALFLTQFAIGIIALVKHVTILAIIVASCFRSAHAMGHLSYFRGFPYRGRIANKNVYRGVSFQLRYLVS